PLPIFIPISAVFAGAFCARIMTLPLFADSPSFATLIMRAGFSLMAIAFAACAFAYSQTFYEPAAAPLRDAGLKLKTVSSSNALIVAADNGDPTLLYYAERKGWHFMEEDGIYNGEPKDSAQAIVDLDELR